MFLIHLMNKIVERIIYLAVGVVLGFVISDLFINKAQIPAQDEQPVAETTQDQIEINLENADSTPEIVE